MNKFCGQIFFLFLAITAATSKYYVDEGVSEDEAKQLMKLFRDYQQPKNKHEHVRHDNIDPHRQDDHDHTNIQSLNLVFKHNNIGRSRPIARTAEEDQQTYGLDDMLCKLGGRCGCRGRSGGLCNHDHANDNLIMLNGNLDNPTANDDRKRIHDHKSRYNSQKGKKNRADDNDSIENLLDDLERALLNRNDDNQKRDDANDVHQVRCKGAECQIVNLNADDRDNKFRDSDDNFANVLNNLQRALLTNNNQDLRCHGDRCEIGNDRLDRADEDAKITNDRRDDDDDDKDVNNKAFLRCCKKCRRSNFYRTNVEDSNESTNAEDDKAYLRCCKKCGKKRNYRTNDRVYDDVSHDDNRNIKDTEDILDRAKVYQINDDLDAILVDVSDIGNIVKLLNNGDNLDSANAMRDFVREGPARVVPKKQRQGKAKLFPMTLKQKMKMKNGIGSSRRNQKPGPEKYGVPFQLDVQGLGQVNA